MHPESAINQYQIEIQIGCYEWLDCVSRPIPDPFVSRWHAPLTDFSDIDMPENEPVGVQSGCYFSVLLQPINPCAISFDRDDLAGLRPYRGKCAAT